MFVSRLPWFAGAAFLMTFVFSLLSMACGGPQQSHRASGEVKRRFAFEFSCPERQIRTRVLSTANGFTHTMGAEGCGRRAVYVYIDQTWVLNTER